VADAEIVGLGALLECEGVETVGELKERLADRSGGWVQLLVSGFDDVVGTGDQEPDLEIRGENRSVFLSFPLRRAQFWADADFVADLARLRIDESDETDDDGAADDPSGEARARFPLGGGRGRRAAE
jgi:hypothetical protein